MSYLWANWPAPTGIYALSTTRFGGASLAPYNENNLALHVGDNPQHVLANRQQLKHLLDLTQEPIWLNQTHSTNCVVAELDENRHADAVITRKTNTPLAIMTADCLPIVLCSQTNHEIAAIHAGWRGLAQGIIENTLDQLQSPQESLLAWIGPAICGQCYSVGEEVKNTFLARYPQADIAFSIRENQRFADLIKIATLILQSHGVKVYLSQQCTVENHQFFSYRNAKDTGRIATLIWFNPAHPPKEIIS